MARATWTNQLIANSADKQ